MLTHALFNGETSSGLTPALVAGADGGDSLLAASILNTVFSSLT